MRQADHGHSCHGIVRPLHEWLKETLNRDLCKEFYVSLLCVEDEYHLRLAESRMECEGKRHVIVTALQSGRKKREYVGPVREWRRRDPPARLALPVYLPRSLPGLPGLLR